MLSTPLNYSCRICQPEDAAFLTDLYFSVHVNEFATLGLPDAMVRNLLRMQSDAQEIDYRRRFPDARRLIVEAHGVRIGRMVVDDQDDSLHLVDISISPTHQRRGFGTGLLQDLIQESAGRPIRLSVLGHNPAKRLYERLGFQVVSEAFPYMHMECFPQHESRRLADSERAEAGVG